MDVPECGMNAMSRKAEETRIGARKQRLTGVNDPIRLPCVKAYVRSMTMMAQEA